MSCFSCRERYFQIVLEASADADWAFRFVFLLQKSAEARRKLGGCLGGLIS